MLLLMRTALRPHQRDGLGEVTDVIIRQREQHRVGAGGDEIADQRRLGVLERQCAGQRAQRVAAVGVLGLAEICGQQAQLVVAARLISEAVE